MKESESTATETRNARVPSVVLECDLRKLPLSPLEAYVFSRVDGSMSEEELVVCTGLDALVVSLALDRLAGYGALRFSNTFAKRPVSQMQPRAGTSSPAPRMGRPSDVVTKPSVSGQRSTAPIASRTTAPPVSGEASRAGFTSPPGPAGGSRGFTSSITPTRAPSPMNTVPPRTSRIPTPTNTAAPARAPTAQPPARRSLTPVPTSYHPTTVRPQQLDQVKRYLDSARIAINEGNATGAANFYRLAQQLAPNDPMIRTALEECAVVSAQARAASERASTLVLVGDNAARSRAWEDAAVAYEEAVNLVPRDPTILYKVAGALYKAGFRLDEAANFAKRAATLTPMRLDCWLLLSQIQLELRAIGPARAAAEEARKIKGDDPRVEKLLAKLSKVG